MIFAVTNRGMLRFMMHESNMTARVLIKFMKRLTKDANRMVFPIFDNLRVHYAGMVKARLAKHDDEIEVFYLSAGLIL